jgi:hypothetical protein
MPKIFSVNVSFPKEVEFEVARTHNDFSYSISKALTNYLTTLTFFCSLLSGVTIENDPLCHLS